jgi:hypothetical protein
MLGFPFKGLFNNVLGNWLASQFTLENMNGALITIALFALFPVANGLRKRWQQGKQLFMPSDFIIYGWIGIAVSLCFLTAGYAWRHYQQPVVSETSLPEPIYKYTGTVKKYANLPQISPSHDQRLWLEQVYHSFQRGKIIVPRITRRELAGQIDPGFEPNSIDIRLITPERTITLLGIWQIAQNTEWIGKTDLVLRYIKQIITEDMKADHLKTTDIGIKLNLTPLDVSACLDLAASVGLHPVMGGGGGNYHSDDFPRLYNEISVGRDDVFKFYERYDGIEKAIDIFVKNPPKDNRPR